MTIYMVLNISSNHNKMFNIYSSFCVILMIFYKMKIKLNGNQNHCLFMSCKFGDMKVEYNDIIFIVGWTLPFNVH